MTYRYEFTTRAVDKTSLRAIEYAILTQFGREPDYVTRSNGETAHIIITPRYVSLRDLAALGLEKISIRCLESA